MQRVDAGTLDEASLGAVWALLTRAHYRTRPSDLAALVEHPGLRLYLARNADGAIAGASAECVGWCGSVGGSNFGV